VSVGRSSKVTVAGCLYVKGQWSTDVVRSFTWPWSRKLRSDGTQVCSGIVLHRASPESAYVCRRRPSRRWPSVPSRIRRHADCPGRAHLHALQALGLRVESPVSTQTVRLAAVGHPREIDWGTKQVVLMAVKSQQTVAALTELAIVAPSETPIVCLQNGIVNEPAALRMFPNVHGVSVACPASHLQPGVVQAWCCSPRARRCCPPPGSTRQPRKRTGTGERIFFGSARSQDMPVLAGSHGKACSAARAILRLTTSTARSCSSGGCTAYRHPQTNSCSDWHERLPSPEMRPGRLPQRRSWSASKGHAN
jgi:hypothetical protein